MARGAAVATEPFTYADGADLVTAGAGKWTYTELTAHITSGALVPDYDSRTYAVWTGAGTFADDQWAEIEIVGGNTVGRHGVLLRSSLDTSPGQDCYMLFQENGTNTYCGKLVNGSQTFFTGYGPSTAFTWANGDKISMEIEGSTIRIYKTPSGGSLTLLDTITDPGASIASGKPGLVVHGTLASSDNWSAGNIETAPAVNLAAIMHHLRQQGIS